MAICTAIHNASGVDYVVRSAGDPSTCPGSVLLSSAEYTNWLAQMSAFGWDVAAFELAAGGALLMFSTGFGIGLIVQLIRRLRTP